MNFRPACLLVMLTTFAPVAELNAQETPSTPSAAPVRRALFTEVEMDRFRAIAAAQERQRESYIRASDEDEVILLEPYLVEGDNSLVLARIRRELERGRVGRRRIFVGLEAASRQDLLFARRSQDAFFRAGSAGRPNDAPSFDGIDLLRLPQKLRPENLRELFRAPPEKVGE